ncbi:hypothetical protein EIP86_009667 [Pleurotus ostreatoroseus]|nr:hypothetical protein EIP86_009667 [Pleurotus ostreatoroseus]
MQDLQNTNTSPSAAERMHHIALDYIFAAIFPDDEENLLDHSVCRGPDSVWCRRLRMKKALMLVSPAWTIPAARYLYRDIALRRVSNLIALAETLRKNPEYGCMIKILRLECIISRSSNKLASRSILAVLANCTNLHGLHLGTLFISSFLTDDWPRDTKFVQASVDSTIDVISRRTSSLRELAFVVDPAVSSLFFPPLSLLKQGSHLVSLTLSIPPWAGEDISALSFPRVKELRLTVPHEGTTGKCCVTQWTLPSLVKLAIFTRKFWPWGTRVHVCEQMFWEILEAHGSNLQFLDLSDLRADDMDSYDLIQVCPNLEHLVLSNASRRWPSFTSPTLHVDVWHQAKSHSWDIQPTIQADREVMQLKAEKLVCGSLRYLSWGLRPLLYLPTILPPRQMRGPSSDERTNTQLPFYLYDVFGMRILELGSGLILEDEYPTRDHSFLWRDITPLAFKSPNDDGESSSDSDSDDESWTWDEDENDASSDEEDSDSQDP